MARIRYAIIATVACSLGSARLTTAQVTSTAAKKPPPTADSLAGITERGRRLAQYDAAAWIASDTLTSRRPDPAAVPQYVARRVGSRWIVAFGRLTEARDTFYVSYEVKQNASNPNIFTVDAFQTPRPDVDYYLRAARAITAARAEFGTPTRPYNAAVLEQPTGAFYVYLMPAQVRHDVFPLGADIRYHYAADGTTLIAKRQLHKALLELPLQSQPGSTLQAGTHAAILDDIPEDTDVFHVLVRQPRVPEYIVTDAFVFIVSTDGSIRNYGRREEVLGPSKKP